MGRLPGRCRTGSLREGSPVWFPVVVPHPWTLDRNPLVARKTKPYWLCRCGHRNDRRVQKCRGDGCNRSKPKRRVPDHEKTLRDDDYQAYVEAARRIHMVADESCCVCGKPRSQERRHDRDHGHLKGDLSYGKPRGLACVSCNRLMPRELDEDRAHLIFLYLRRVRKFYELRQEGV